MPSAAVPRRSGTVASPPRCCAGQKCRLCLALVMYTKPHILIMDEPTNHLDLETVNALIEAIKEFDGGASRGCRGLHQVVA